MATSKTTKSRRAVARRSGKAGAPKDALALLKADHREVSGWFDDYEDAESATEKAELSAKICQALKVHTQIEEEIFYPAARNAIKDEDLLDEATVEHAGAKDLIAQIEAAKVGDPLYDAKVKVLGEQVKHHIGEEEQELFPEAREAKMDLVALGERMAARKAELMGATPTR
ncbi:MAG: hemerythrin domain-containing protein [Caulobacteraceae bacterium]|nr:hemerythrin domain-containing protein [Caulobacteraceae bacterium]